MKRIGGAILFLLLTFAIFGFLFLKAQAQWHTAEETENPKGPHITVYTDLPQGTISLLVPSFRADTGICADVTEMTGDEMKESVCAGKRADVYLASQKVLMDLAQKGALASYTYGTEAVPADFKDEDGRWTGLFVNPVVFAVNRDFAEKNPNFIYSWNDVWQRKSVRIAMLDFHATEFSSDSLMCLVEHYGTAEAYRLLAEAAPHVVQYGEYLSMPAQMAAMDKCDIGISGYHEARRLQADNMPIRILYPEEGTWYFLYGTALDAGAGNDAKAFFDWLFSKGASDKKLSENGFLFIPANAETWPADDADGNLYVWDLKKKYTESGKTELLEKWVRDVRFADNS